MALINAMQAFPTTYDLTPRASLSWITVLFLDDLTTAVVPFPSDYISVQGNVGGPSAKATTVTNFKRGTSTFFAYLFQAGDDRFDTPNNIKDCPNGFYKCVRITKDVYGTYVGAYQIISCARIYSYPPILKLQFALAQLVLHGLELIAPPAVTLPFRSRTNANIGDDF